MNYTTIYSTTLGIGEERNLTLAFFVPNRTDLLNKTYASRIILDRIHSDGSRSELDSLSFRIRIV
jgi:hypothetical protein